MQNGNLPNVKRPFHAVIIAGSDRRQYNCPGVDSKARTLMRIVQRQSGRQLVASQGGVSTTGRMDCSFARFVQAEGKVTPNKYRPFGYQPPGHCLADVRLAWRDIRMRSGSPRTGTSPAKRQMMGFNRDVTKDPKKSEGEKLRAEQE